jgi:DNA helicase-2/ATP-dependent DNA helicase PcrA
MHGLWQTNIPSRFLDELPEANVEVTEAQGGFGGYGGYGASRFDATTSFGSNYNTPGWQRAQAKKAAAAASLTSGSRYERSTTTGSDGFDDASTPSPWRARERKGGTSPRRLPLTIEGELVAKSTGTTPPSRSATACSTRNSATATSPPSTATS